MNRWIRMVVSPALMSVACCALLGCGGAAEEKPPEKGYEMTPEEQQNMEAEKERMMKMRQGQR